MSLDEVDQIMGAKGKPLFDRFALQHFLYRVRLTLHNAFEANREAQRAVEAASQKKARAGTPTTLSPMDAVRYASPEELSIIVGSISSSQLTTLQQHISTARELRTTLLHDLEAIRRAAETISRRDDIPAGVRAEFVTLLNSLPHDVPEVATPKALELGHMAGLVKDETDARGATSLPPAAGPLALSAPAARTEPDTSGGLVLASDPAGSADSTVDEQMRELAAVSTLTQYGPTPPWQHGPGLVLAT